MKFHEFMLNLFDGGGAPSLTTGTIRRGCPSNVGPGGVARLLPVVVAQNIRQHRKKDGTPLFTMAKGGKGRPIPVMLHRGVPAEIFTAKVQAVKRKAAGRHVW